MNKALIISMTVLGTLVLGACGDKPQTAGTTPKSDTKAWEGSAAVFAAEGYKAGDKAAWEQQLRQRAQSQNDYARAPAQPQ
jgi:hypothetical protein